MSITVQPVPLDIRPFNTVTVGYHANEDRLLLALNAGTPQSCGFWLTRRLTLRLLEQAQPFIEKSSSRVAHAPTAYRGEVASFERQAAVASTKKNLTKTPRGLLTETTGHAELVDDITLSVAGAGFRVSIHGRNGGQAAGNCARDDLQGIMHMIEQEVAKTDWRGGAAVPTVASAVSVSDTSKQRPN